VVRNALANAAGATLVDGKNAYEALGAKSFIYHFGAIGENKGKCMLCHDTTRNSDHKSRDCPILKKLGFKLEKRMVSDNAVGDAASHVTAPPAGNVSRPAPAPAPASDATSGSGSIPGAYAAAAEPDSYDSGDDYDYKGKSSSLMYSGTWSGKSNSTSLAYISTSPSCNHTSNNAPNMGGSYDTPATTSFQIWGATTSPHVPLATLKASRLSTFPRQYLRSSRTPWPTNQTISAVGLELHFSWQTREPRTTCYLISWLSFLIIQLSGGKFAWATILLLQSLGMAPPSSL
jgi:hypothetical protein